MKKSLNFCVSIILFVVIIGFQSSAVNQAQAEDSEAEYCGPDVALIMDEAYGNAVATKYIFDFAEEIGYWPSAVFGPYCFDMRDYTIHDTDSDCVSKIPYESRMSCWTYSCDNLSDVKHTIKDNSYLSQFTWMLCPKCCS